jgi:hypothetical protein
MCLASLYATDRIVAHYRIVQARDQILITFSCFYVSFIVFVVVASALRWLMD